MTAEKIINLKNRINSFEKPVSPGKVEVSKNGQLVERGVEQKIEKSFEKSKEIIEQEKSSSETKEITDGGLAAGSQAQVYYQARVKAIDDILSAGLHEIYLNMNPAKQKEFKQVGEETVVKIAGLLEKAKVKVDKIIDLIRKWLKIIPGVNKFFLEQEAKIKADRIIKLKNNN